MECPSIQADVMIPHSYIQIMYFYQQYHGSAAEFLSVHDIGATQMLICPIATDVNSYLWSMVLSESFSTVRLIIILDLLTNKW